MESPHLHARQSGGGYLPIENYGMIGNMRTCALVGMDGAIDYMCWPDFDSPSVFCRLLDKDQGGYFSIHPSSHLACTAKQQYEPSSNILQTKYIHEKGVLSVLDFFPRPDESQFPARDLKHSAFRETKTVQEELKRWLVRRVECTRGEFSLEVEVFPAFNYAKANHETTIHQSVHDTSSKDSKSVTFVSENGMQRLQLDVTIDYQGDVPGASPSVTFHRCRVPGKHGDGVLAQINLREGQAVSFVLRDEILDDVTSSITTLMLDNQEHNTRAYWSNWISRSKYTGRWREVVQRSLLILKMMTYEPTGAIIAAPTFSLPENIGGTRNWDYRYCWIRDSSFTIYIFLRMGFIQEADAFMEFITKRLLNSSPDGGLPIMFTIRGNTKIPEVELGHLQGYRGSKPVRVGNGAAFHLQFDTYGELMDAIYLYNKYGKPVTWDQWCAVRTTLDYVLTIMNEPDMSIWEVRNQKQNFTYSKIMLWVAFDRGLRLADKRNLPCPNRAQWLAARDGLMEEVMEKGYNKELGYFVQSYENNTSLDSSILIAPLVFFVAPNDPRFLKTMERIELSPEKGGLTSNGLVSRYNTELSEDGVGGKEGAFSMCTFWLVEAMTRASVYEPEYLSRAISYFENMLTFSNHLMMFSEEISMSGEQLGNTPQAFSHLALISAAFNIDRATQFAR